MGQVDNKIKFAIIGAFLVPCFGRLALHGTGHEHDYYRYFVPFFVGGLAGFLIGLMKDRWAKLHKNLESFVEDRTNELRDEIKERKRVEDALREAHDQMEHRVDERTEELKIANEKLKGKIEEHKEAEEALKENEEKYRTLVENLNEIIYSTDEMGRVTYISPNILAISGYTPSELMQKSFIEFVHPEDLEARIENFQEVMSGKNCVSEYRFITKDKRTFWARTNASPIIKDGRAVGVQGVIADITESKHLQAQLEHAQKMESIGILTSGVAHNFRNILTGILANNQLLQLIYKYDHQLLEIAQRTVSAVLRGAQLVKDLMQFSRKEREGTFQQINLAQVLKETCQLISESFDKKIDIRIGIPESLPIMGNHSELNQVFMNLCTNARDAMPEGGKLRIEANKEGDSALVTIFDTGHGMDEESMKKCFDPFFTTKEVNKGIGLGLSTSYGIVKDHGGEIHVFSEANKGTTFKLCFPLAAEEKEREREETPEIVLGSGPEVFAGLSL